LKPSVSIATIVCGTALLVVPYLSNAVGMVTVSATVAHLNRPFNLNGHMPEWYDGACFTVGLLMVVVGVGAALWRGGGTGRV
jgi:hypothetical protein